MNNIYLIGFMGVGKSTIGKKLASKLGLKFIDTDVIFQEKYRLNIDSFFDKYGEELFRKLEYEILKTTFNNSNCVIATGGGLPCYIDAMDQINKNGISIYLKMNPDAILSRLQSSKQKRPLVTDKSINELKDFIHKKLDERNPSYSKAMITVSALSIDIESILDKLNHLDL